MMKALILAAGLGTRLRPMTDTKPKSMVEVNGMPILFQQVDNLEKNGIKDIVVVAGYKADIMISALGDVYPSVKVIRNRDYDKTNNMYSAYLARDEFCDRDFILMNADVFCDSTIIQELLKDCYDNAIVVQEGFHSDENMKVQYVDGKIVEISKDISKQEAYGVSIDVYRFSSEGSVVFFGKTTEYIEERQVHDQWTEVALNDTLKEVTFRPCPARGRWMEIDTHDDLKKAESIFR